MSDSTSFQFLVSWYEPMAGITREYALTYFVPSSNSVAPEVSIFDIKNKKMFLKKVSYPSISISDLFLGNIVTIYSRQYEIVGYGNQKTRETFEATRGKLVAVLPEILYSEFGNIFLEAANQNLHISKLKSLIGGPNQRLELWVEFVGDDVDKAWSAVGKAIPALKSESVQVEAPSPETDSVFASNKTSATMDHCALCIIKPHAVKEGTVGAILNALSENKLEISAMQLFRVNRLEAENFLEVYKGVINNSEYSDSTAELASGPLVAVEVRAESCVEKLRQVCGPHDVEIARALRPSTIRARFGKNNVQNAVHCTDLEEDGILESQFFFDIVMKSQKSAV